ncbi:MAG: NAD-dependent epimerase/dehydratase family protein [Rhodobacteraceae bacterium]|nr:NAD-dependent epimerase/dehydratase family protein [Paracoccaceae bacterium]
MRILLTGANGFVGKNLAVRLNEQAGFTVLPMTRETTPDELRNLILQADAVVHLAGVNRPVNEQAFTDDNDTLTQDLCAMIRKSGHKIPIIAASSIQAGNDTAYGQSKRAGERHLEALANECGVPVAIYRLVNVFGKWCQPNYNSVVATFCHNAIHDLPITVNDPAACMRLIYIDDLVDAWIKHLKAPNEGLTWPIVAPEYEITVGALDTQIQSFRSSRDTHKIGAVGTGLLRALYATYLSHLPPAQFSYPLTRHEDERGVFAEMLRTENSGQFSFFTAHPGITRGGHYHHTKNEKFLVLSGQARFCFKNILTGEVSTLDVKSEESQVVETVPGWAHDITNIGESEMVVMLWANELFDQASPDTFAAETQP